MGCTASFLQLGPDVLQMEVWRALGVPKMLKSRTLKMSPTGVMKVLFLAEKMASIPSIVIIYCHPRLLYIFCKSLSISLQTSEVPFGDVKFTSAWEKF